jgi:hypothetical protein
LKTGPFLREAAALGLLLALPQSASAIRVGAEDRSTFDEFRKRNKLTPAQMRSFFDASLRIVCPWNTANASLVTSTGVFVTVDHIFFGAGAPKRNPLGKCHLESFNRKRQYKIDTQNFYRGPDLRPQALPYEQDFFIGRVSRSKNIEPPIPRQALANVQ